MNTYEMRDDKKVRREPKAPTVNFVEYHARHH